jgi:hypothetical protein
LSPQIDFEPQQGVKSLTFRSITAITLANSFCQLMGALARIYLQRFKQTFRDRSAALKKKFS